jgi:hypothetical protein
VGRPWRGRVSRRRPPIGLEHELPGRRGRERRLAPHARPRPPRSPAGRDRRPRRVRQRPRGPQRAGRRLRSRRRRARPGWIPLGLRAAGGDRRQSLSTNGRLHDEVLAVLHEPGGPVTGAAA